MWNIVSSSSLTLHVWVLFTYILSIMTVVLRVLLSVNESHSVDVVILVVVMLVSPHDQFLFSPFQPNRSHWFGTITRDINVCHVLVVLVASLPLSWRIYVRKHTASINIWRIIHIHILILVVVSICFVDRGLSLHGSMMVRVQIAGGRVVSELLHLVLVIIVIVLPLSILEVLFRGIVSQKLLLFLLVFVLDGRRIALWSILFVISLIMLFLLQVTLGISFPHSSSFATWFLQWWVIIDGIIFKLVFSVFISIIHGLHRGLFTLRLFKLVAS